jgi:hypothetical protein
MVEEPFLELTRARRPRVAAATAVSRYRATSGHATRSDRVNLHDGWLRSLAFTEHARDDEGE